MNRLVVQVNNIIPSLLGEILSSLFRGDLLPLRARTFLNAHRPARVIRSYLPPARMVLFAASSYQLPCLAKLIGLSEVAIVVLPLLNLTIGTP